MSPKTVIEKAPSPSPDVTVFRISGTLGFHEKETLEKLFGECKKRRLHRVVFDVQGLTSLGGGCANIIRAAAATGEIVVGFAGAKKTVLKFLQDTDSRILVSDTVDDAVAQLSAAAPEGAAASPPEAESGDAPEPRSAPAAAASKPAPAASKPAPAASKPAPAKSAPAKPAPAKSAPPAASVAGSDRDLQRRIIQYNTLFSLNAEFARLRERRSLIDQFLLTAIAQAGVESAIFLEFNRGYFVPTGFKGIEANEVRGFVLASEQLRLDEWRRTGEIYTIDDNPFGDDVKAPLLSLGCAYVAPFIVHGAFRGVVLLGNPIKSDLDATTLDFLKILINQAALAFESMARFEEENERTLGLVQTLIALIEENTLARGNSNLISNYVYAVAQALHYDEEHVKDLMYGTVLRDIGMIKVSDLIVRSPRELVPEEWEIIKRHPIDGAEMLRKMKFSEHAAGIVASHHERFNGEGYPHGLQGQDIPLGARIVSIVESFAAMLQVRPTRPALSDEEALNTLKENWGMRYDPDVVRKFVEIVEIEIRGGESAADRKFELFSVK
jgi:HD-GYP domain-containing protein (c-di-GMP phosphodiesterase class II)